jgi:hypothetical protein
MGRVRWIPPADEIPHLTPTLSAPKGGEGELQLPAYGIHYARDVFPHVPVPEPDHPISVMGNLLSAQFIVFPGDRMLSAIELDSQLRAWTSEIHNVPPDRMLATNPVPEPKLA